MGFYARSTLDSRTGLTEVQYFERAFPYAGLQFQDVLSNGAFYISESVGTHAVINLDSTANNQRYFPYFNNWTVARREVGGIENGILTSTSSTNYTYNSYGNATNVTETVTDNDPNSPYVGQQWSTTTVTSITEDASGNWCLTQPNEADVTRTSPGSSVTRHVGFGTPDYANCRPTEKITEPGSPSYTLTEAYSYDAFGNISDVNVSGVGVALRNTHTDWDITGQFPMSVRNALSQTTTYGYDFNFGFRTSAQDPNLISTSWTDDEFGRKKSETRPDGTSTVWTYVSG